jgi:hypothetical protein
MTYSMIKTPMVDLVKKASYSLAKNGLQADGKGGVKVRLVLDHSLSMKSWYASGAVQRLTEQVLGLASALDDDGTIETWYFGTGVSKAHAVSLKSTEPDSYYVGWVDRSHRDQPWGTTNYPAGLKAPVDFQRAANEDEPALVIFQTDGGPNDRELANQMLRKLSGEKTFFAFVVFGREDDIHPWSAAEYMKGLDTLSGRVRDNASVFFTGELDKYETMSDEVLYDGVLREFVKSWLPQVL